MNSVEVTTGGGAGMALAHAIVHGHAPSISAIFGQFYA
jgi:hypothetical protein